MVVPEWYSRNLRRLFFDMHLPDWTQPGQSGGDQSDLRGIATRFDPDYLVSEFVRARINTAVIFAKCQFGNFYYNTKIGHKHVGLGDLDLLGEVVERAHRHDIRVIGYYSNMWDTQAAREHPEWMAEEADGSYSYNRWPTMSLLSPYRDLVHAHLREMFTQYDLDGVWSDILSDLPSYDRYTRERYEQDTGDSMPDGASYFTIFWRIIMPLSRPALMTLGIITFVFWWNEYFTPLVMIHDQNLQVLPSELRFSKGASAPAQSET